MNQPVYTPTEALITFRVSLLSQRLARAVESAVSVEMGLSSRQWRVLVSLNRLGAVTASEIVQFSNLDKSQVSRVVQELEPRGLIHHAGDARDRRRIVLSLTAAGREMVSQGLAGSESRQAFLRAALSDADYAVFERALGQLTEAADTLLAQAKASRASDART